MAGFDIETQAEAAKVEDEGIEVHVHSINDEPMYFGEDNDQPVVIVTAGSHSKLFRREEEKLRKRKLKARQLTGEQVYEDNVQKAAACVLGWSGFVSNGTPVDCTKHNVAQVYKRCPWVFEQMLEAMNDHSRFFENGSNTQPNI